ncbi:DUF1934 domain-containing protein [Limosilactobacillus caccae]|uniref:DUF1934 domain-containing protein n=1 Tax=Limosilactobacillus caccae TaxID=1926284 RepID=UPI001F45D371|nr:DUF1934 domain-containing protein [Limosilactobacillus caccae]
MMTKQKEEEFTIKRVVPVQVKLATTISQDGQQEHFSFTEAGSFVEMNGKYYLRYLEHQQGQETPVQVRFDEQLVRLRRKSVVETNLLFDPHRSTVMRYRTQYGLINLEVATEKLDLQLDPATPAGRLRVSYRLKNAGQIVGSYQLELQFMA